MPIIHEKINDLLKIITPEMYNSYMRTKTEEKSMLVKCGVAVSDPKVSTMISGGGTIVTMPFWNDLDSSRADEGLGTGDKAISTESITAAADLACVMYRGQGWKVNEMQAVFSGDDPLGALMDRISDYWIRREQQVLISVLNGLFAQGDTKGPLVDTHLLNKASENISPTMVLQAKQLLGDSSDRVSMLVMHSATYTELQIQNLIEFIPNARGEVNIPTYLGYNVVVDDGVPYDEATGVYTTFLFGRGAIGRNDGSPDKLTTFEVARDSSRGNDEIYTRRAFVMHPYGVKFTSEVVADTTPDNIELSNPKNWQRVYEPKKIGIIAIKHNVGKDIVTEPETQSTKKK